MSYLLGNEGLLILLNFKFQQAVNTVEHQEHDARILRIISKGRAATAVWRGLGTHNSGNQG